MIRFYRLRNGRLTWSRGGQIEQVRHLTGRLLNIESMDDGSGDAWRIVILVQCEAFTAKVSVRMTEPEVATLLNGIDQTNAGDKLTISGSGRISVGGNPPTASIDALDLNQHDWVSLMELADRVANDWQRRGRDRMSQSRPSERTGRTA